MTMIFVSLERAMFREHFTLHTLDDSFAHVENFLDRSEVTKLPEKAIFLVILRRKFGPSKSKKKHDFCTFEAISFDLRLV